MAKVEQIIEIPTIVYGKRALPPKKAMQPAQEYGFAPGEVITVLPNEAACRELGFKRHEAGRPINAYYNDDPTNLYFATPYQSQRNMWGNVSKKNVTVYYSTKNRK